MEIFFIDLAVGVPVGAIYWDSPDFYVSNATAGL
jgi:hypothetical protein